jgi:nucleoside-diphosphate-sugar epimerase
MRRRLAVTVLVTGATGLLGSHIVDLLVQHGERVRALARPGSDIQRLVALGVDVRFGDLGNQQSLKAVVCGVERVLHCAARTGPWGPEIAYKRANVLGLRALVGAADAAGVRRFVHVSSITVHGNDVQGAADETAPLRSEPNPYSRTKVEGEQLLMELIHERGAPITIVRPGWIYGPRDFASFARFATLIRDGRMVMIGSGANHIPLIYVGDAAEGVILASAAQDAIGRAYLLVNDERITQRDYFTAIANELGAPAPSKHVPYRAALALGATAELVGSLARLQRPPLTRYGMQLLGGENRFIITKARQELGFAPRVMLADGVRQSVAWYRTTACASGARAGEGRE